MMNAIFWSEFTVLFIAAILGSAAVMPYAFKLLNQSRKKSPIKLSITALVLLSIVQTAVLSAIAVSVGLFVSHSVGLGAPFIEAALTGSSIEGLKHVLIVAGGTGALAGLSLLIADLFFLPYWPQALLDASRQTTLRDNFLASFYGGIDEEIFMHLFGFSILVWLFSFLAQTPGQPSLIILWIANSIMTIIFGLGHLPALKNVVGGLPRLMVFRSLLLNAPVGLFCGWLFWTYGIEAAIVAHFFADIIYHVFGSIVLNRRHNDIAN